MFGCREYLKELIFFSFFEKGFNERKKKLFYKLHIVVLNYLL